MTKCQNCPCGPECTCVVCNCVVCTCKHEQLTIAGGVSVPGSTYVGNIPEYDP